MDFINTQTLVISIAEFIVAIVSSIVQGGGNYIILPLMLSFGIAPVTANAALSLSNLGFSAGSVIGLKNEKIQDKNTLLVLMALGGITGLFVPFILVHMDAEYYGIFVGCFLFIIAPILHFKKFGVVSVETNTKQKIKGYILLTILFIVARFTLGVGALFTYVLCKYCGLTLLEANKTRKVSGFAGGTITTIGVIFAGFVNWPITIGLTLGAIIGAYIGTKITVKKGNAWTAKALTITMLISGVILIITSIK